MILCVDGSAAPNPGPGGYGVIFLTDDEEYIKYYSHYEENTTNNIQELKVLNYFSKIFEVGIEEKKDVFQKLQSR